MQIYLYLVTYVILIIGLSIYISKSSSTEDFLIGGRNRSGWTILFSKFAGAIGVSTLITYTGYAYKFGWGLFAMSIGSVIGYLLFAFWAAPRIKRLSMQGNFYTQGDLPAYITANRTTGLLTNVITIIVQFFWILLSLAGGAKVITFFGLFTYEIALLITTSVVLIYVLFSGYKAVIITDIIQAIIILSFLCILIYGMVDLKDLDNVLAVSTTETVQIGSVVGLILYGGLSVFGLADRYQLCYAAKDIKSLKTGMSLAIIPVLVIAFLLLIIGLYVYQLNTTLDPDTVFVFAMQNLVNESWMPLLLVLFFAGLMSTADTSIFAVSSHLIYTSEKNNKVKSLRYATIFTVILAFITALFWKNVVDITIIGAALRMTLSVAMIYVIRERKNSGRFIASALGGVIGLLLGIAAFGPKPTIAITVLVGSLTGLIFRSKQAC
ncbi:sodium:solute symporter [Aquimarina sp. SS2-1]|uniref:sodium:solute symporter family protein n=1 Tax=Aquimarina besae TaxID=3342247 RepID=UPI00366B31C5